MPAPGDRVAERYVIEELIGEGGLAEVYRVRHIDLGGLHALKLLTWRRKSVAERLLLEGRIQAQLRHPNVVGVTDVVRHEGRFGLLMEYVDCITLDAFIADHGALGADEALQLFAMVMSGMAAAHDAGVLHRDLKPANILLARQGGGWMPKVTDFGIAKVVADDVEASHSTASGAMMGTPGYMAPEQVVDAADVDERADIFALAVVLYELLSGHHPFAGEEGYPEPRSTLELDAPPLSEFLSEVRPAVEEALQQALSRDRDARFASVRAFGEALFKEHPQLAASLSQAPLETALTLDSRADTLQRLSEPPRADPPAQAGDLRSADRQTYGLVEGQAATGSTSPTAEEGATDRRGAGWWLPAGLVGGALVAVMAVWGPFGANPQVAPTVPDDLPDVPEAPSQTVPPTPEEVSPSEGTPAPTAQPAPVPAVVPKDGSQTPSQTAEVAAPDKGAPEEGGPNAATPEVEATAAEEAIAADSPEDIDAVALVEVVERPEPAPVDATPALAGTWSGTASGRPFELRITSANNGVLAGTAVFLFGATPRVTSVRGTYDPSSGSIRLSADDNSVVFEGQGSTTRLTGTYRQATGKKSFPWDVSR